MDDGIAALAYLGNGGRQVGGGQIVEQHAIGDFPGQLQHLRVERRHDDLGPALGQAHPQAEALGMEVVALKGDLLAGQAFAQQRYIFPHERNGLLAGGQSVRAQDAGRRHAQPQEHLHLGVERLQGGGGHGGKGRAAQLHRRNASGKPQAGRRHRNRAQEGHGVRASRLDRPKGIVAKPFGAPRDIHHRRRPQHPQAAKSNPHRNRCHECLPLLSASAQFPRKGWALQAAFRLILIKLASGKGGPAS